MYFRNVKENITNYLKSIVNNSLFVNKKNF